MSVMNFDPVKRLAACAWARDDFYSFVRYTFLRRKNYKWLRAPHHQIICDALVRVFEGKCRRLIINCPPRYSKTELLINFIAWTLGKAPDSEYLYVSYSSRLAATNAWMARELVLHDVFGEIFPEAAMRDDSQARDEWRTTAGGCVYAVGAGGALTGYGAGKHRETFGGAIIIDDPHKADEARSDTMRRNVIEWFLNSLQSRVNSPHTPMILIMQRLHQQDLAGFLLEGGSGEPWEHINLPAITDRGEALWPEKHDLAALRALEEASPYNFAGQYMQRPAPTEGGIFRPHALQAVDSLPADMREVVRAWDFGSTLNGDYSAGAKLGKLPDGRFVIMDIARFRHTPHDRDAILKAIAARDGYGVRIDIPQDPGQAGKTQIQYLTKELAGYSVQSSPESGDKATRAEPFASQLNVGNVLMLRGAWNQGLIDELRLFPNAKYDDQVDALSRAFAALLASGLGEITDEVLNAAGPAPARYPGAAFNPDEWC